MSRMEKFAYGLLVIIAVIAILGIFYSLFGSGDSEERVDLAAKDSQKPVITLVLRETQSDFWQTVTMGAEAAAKEFGLSLVVEAPADSDDISGQQALVTKSLKGKSKALIVAAADDVEMAKTVVSARIPVIAIDTDIEAPSVRTFIGVDNYEAGKKAGEQIAEMMSKQGQVVILSSVKDDRNMELRMRGILDAFKPESFVTVLDNRYCLSGIEACEQVVQSLMNATLVDGIVALDAEAAIGAGRELVRRGEEERVQVVAFESAHEQLEQLQDGVLEATIVQNPFSMGYLGVKHAVEAIDGDQIPRRVEIPSKVIDRENMFWMDNQKLLFPFVK
ncbi:ribose transport system substrate-binding protein [Paenibacillus phyllosphaerae]|uniref:Ribose transport system substrate-binding protein n=1 Tax=Paenibacillus phyllosphaerae TaxID=274593 RepID=A0A7W5B1C9_9BACL|nr:substrate-binding domain-containing protein [Paenibacillus phyllosphaerae]MBB3112654.1 ribose transport system substrate-binding protein [Paenibacillus phyllosphaerae]